NHQRPHRSVGRRTPAVAYAALPKATPATPAEPEWRTRTDRVAATGTVSLRYAGKLRHLGIGRAHAGKPVLILIQDTRVITSHADTGEILAEHHLDADRDYHPATRHHIDDTLSRDIDDTPANPQKKP
ncbi:IS481 family transposase, partial [Ornithinimicrobium tianjinense]